MSKYDALATYLRAQPHGRPELALSLEAIEEILGSDLPEAARQYRPWWANTRSSHHGSKWLAAGWKVERVNLSIGLIVFVRADVASIRAREEPGGYAGLKRFLHTLPSQQEQLALDFSELRMVIGHKLPNTALHDRPWWANTVASPQGSAWVSAGWQVDNVYLRAQIVVFRRMGGNPLRMIPRYVKAILDGSPTFGHPSSHTLAKWIRFCRTVGWYFQGTVLYDRGGLSFDALSDLEQVEVEEDYTVCRRELIRYKSERLS